VQLGAADGTVIRASALLSLVATPTAYYLLLQVRSRVNGGR
jgi:hypothetical protein